MSGHRIYELLPADVRELTVAPRFGGFKPETHSATVSSPREKNPLEILENAAERNRLRDEVLALLCSRPVARAKYHRRGGRFPKRHLSQQTRTTETMVVTSWPFLVPSLPFDSTAHSCASSSLRVSSNTMINMMFTVVSLIESMLFTAILMLLVLCWLSEANTNIAVEVWNAIVLIRNVFQVIIKDEYTTGKNQDPDVEEPESADSSGNRACHQASSSLAADLISPSFPLYVWSSQPGDNAAQSIDESCMESIIQVVNLTIRGAQPVEKSLKYFQFILFGLNMGEQMYRRIYCHLHDQLVWWYYRVGDSELEIVGKLYGGFIVLGMRLNLSDDWKPSARMVLNHLENYDILYLNFARSAFKQLNQDLPQKYSHLIKEMIDKPRINAIRKEKPIVLPSYAYSYEYL
ncbi:Hypothetical protein CINCED_3A024140 [Cinara cedri]|uniref:Uncharacterized protein n=1 Tax=Cinara cedri TaxID=506608 RepID=A0A5E4NHB8_9HEMI|nr:Hypothetical protein CINCED_3A024140 [Cinara cedri]